MTRTRRWGANVILECDEGVTLQLRDDLHLWGIFGGLIEDGEEPRTAAIREIEEELTIRLDPKRLLLLNIFEGPDITSYLFCYRIKDELNDAILTEGIKFETKTREDLSAEETVPWHWQMLEWYWEENRAEDG